MTTYEFRKNIPVINSDGFSRIADIEVRTTDKEFIKFIEKRIDDAISDYARGD